MKILYNQNKNATSLLNFLKIDNCYLKYITDSSTRVSSRKPHHHTFYEVHIITDGLQVYEIGGKRYDVSKGNMLFISPRIPHRLLHSSKKICKFAICFNSDKQTEKPFFKTEITPVLLEGLNLLYDESGKSTEFSLFLTECRLCEIIITLLRFAGYREGIINAHEGTNSILSLAKQYITDNIERAPTVSEVANYCCISERQLTRLFATHEKQTPKQFITDVKIKKIAKLILDDDLSLREISDRMGFASEYYFNALFKKHFGLPPSNYRKMHGK